MAEEFTTKRVEEFSTQLGAITNYYETAADIKGTIVIIPQQEGAVSYYKFTVESGVPISRRKALALWNGVRDAFRDMKISQSIFIEIPNDKEASHAVRNLGGSALRHFTGQFVIRRVFGGVRIWKIPKRKRGRHDLPI